MNLKSQGYIQPFEALPQASYIFELLLGHEDK
jgi:hypothetical protein